MQSVLMNFLIVNGETCIIWQVNVLLQNHVLLSSGLFLVVINSGIRYSQVLRV
jgi:hypothetical protein